ncbi:unnamed protein product [Pedinophyceae sp. YPF-701]|nr:unnamed protein product [Pedinophyceae sp. YPF-701]
MAFLRPRSLSLLLCSALCASVPCFGAAHSTARALPSLPAVDHNPDTHRSLLATNAGGQDGDTDSRSADGSCVVELGLRNVTKNTRGPVGAGESIDVHAYVDPDAAAGRRHAFVALTWRVDFGGEQSVLMQPTDSNTYKATIPPSLPGSMVRWYVRATERDGSCVQRKPKYRTRESPRYYGTAVWEPDVESLGVGVLRIFAQDESKLTALQETDGTRCSLLYLGRFYDNVFCRRRGVTALAWAKPKIKLDFKGEEFGMWDGAVEVEEVNLQSFWEEPGEETYMREIVALQLMRDSGVPASQSQYVVVHMNAAFFGLFNMIEQVDDTFLRRRGLAPGDAGGMLFKSVSGQMSNLRWDVKVDDMRWSYRKGNRRDSAGDFAALKDLTLGLAGRGPGTRSQYVFDHVDLFATVSEMAVQSMLLNQDRCTKNFYSYYNAWTRRWMRIPWDLESSLGISSGLGGAPAPDYCVLACDQWNSPLYCDSDHPQDIFLERAARADGISPVLPSWGSSVFGRRRLQQTWGDVLASITTWGRYRVPGEDESRAVAAPSAPPPAVDSTTSNGAAPYGTAHIPDVNAPRDFDAPRQGSSPVGPAGTYNHLYDAILDIPWTREMYLRRLRTLMDRWLGGRLQGVLTGIYAHVRYAAKADEQRWRDARSGRFDANAGDIDRGYRQLLDEQIPRRRQQLYERYGPGGAVPLIPDAQPRGARLALGEIVADSGGVSYVELRNENAFAMDVSGWRLGGAAAYVLPEGTVVPSRFSLFVASDPVRFVEARRLQRRLVQGPMPRLAAGKGLSLADADGGVIDVATAR